MTIQVPNTYTEVGDDGSATTGILTETSSAVTATALASNSTVYLYKDFGASYFTGTAYAEGTIVESAHSGTTACSFITGFSDDLGDLESVTNEACMRVIYGSVLQYQAIASVAGAIVGAASDANLVEGTTYYYRFGFFSALSRYGSVLVQMYSDVGRATKVSQALYALTATASYRYFHLAQSQNTAVAQTVTVTNQDVTVTQAGVGIDLTTGVETDTGTGRLVVYADCIVATALNIANSETAKHVAIDEGAGFFADYTVSDVLNITAFGGTGTLMQYFEMLTVCDAAASSEALNDSQGIAVYWVSTTTYKMYIHQAIGGTDTFSTAGPTLNINQPYTITLNRTGTTLTMKVWNDLVLTNFEGASQVGSDVTWTGRAATTYRYLLPVTSFLSGATSRSSTFTLGGVHRQGNPPAPPTTGYGTSYSLLRTSQTATFNKEFSFTSASAVFPISATTYSKVGVSDVVTLLRVLSQTEGVNPNVVRTFARLMLTSSSAYTRSGGAGSAAREGKSTTAITATKSSSNSTVGRISAKVTITTVGYSGIFLKLISVRFTKLNATTGIQEPVSGLTPTLKVKRGTDGNSLDFDDDLFKATGWIDIDANLLETDPTNYPGTYDYFLQVNGFGNGENIVYQLFVQDTTLGYYADGTIIFRDGVEQWGGMTAAQNTAVITTIPAAVAALPTAAVNADAVWDEVLTKNTHNTANSAGKIVRQLRGMTIHEGTAQAGGLNTITLDTGASATNHIYKECLIVIIAGTAAGEAHHILSYNGLTKLAVVDQNWYVQPDNTSDFIMFGSSAHDTVETGVAQAATTTSITLNGTAATTDDLYNDQMVFISSGTGTGQVRRFTDYVGATKVATVDKVWTITPDSTSGYMLYPAVDNALAVRTNLAAEVIDGTITRIEKERAELAETLGHGTVPAGAGTYAFKAQDGTTTRIGGTVDANGVRTVTTINGAP